MPEMPEDPLAAFGQATAKPATDTTTRMKERLDIYVAQERSRGRRQRRKLLFVAAGLVVACLCAAAFVVLSG